MAKILVVDDDVDLCSNVANWLDLEHHTVETANTGELAQEMLLNFQYDLAVLDITLPGIGGVELCKRFREKNSSTPVLFLTGRGDIVDKAAAFTAGADDYLTKPFNMMELGLRVRALLRRAGQEIRITLKAGALEMDPDTFTVRNSGSEVKLLPKEFALLEFLLRHPKQIFSLENLLDRVWVSDTDASTDAVHACIRRLRRKIDDVDGKVIVNVRGVGYKLEP